MRPTVLERLRDQEELLIAAVVRGDVAAIAACISDDALFCVCKRLLRSKPAITAYLTTHFEDPRDTLLFKAPRFEVQSASNLTLCRGMIVSSLSRREIGAYELLWRRETDDSWKIAFAQVVTTTKARVCA